SDVREIIENTKDPETSTVKAAALVSIAGIVGGPQTFACIRASNSFGAFSIRTMVRMSSQQAARVGVPIMDYSAGCALPASAQASAPTQQSTTGGSNGGQFVIVNPQQSAQPSSQSSPSAQPAPGQKYRVLVTV